MSAGENIELLVQGTTPSLVNTQKGNEVIQKLNSLLNIRLIEGEEYAISYSDENVVITLKSSEDSGSIQGFEEIDVFLCVNGNAQLKTILAKDP